MNKTKNARIGVAGASLALVLGLALPALAEDAKQGTTETSGRAIVVPIEAEVTAIDLKTREVSLLTAAGNTITLVAPEKVVKLEDVKVGDRLEGTMFAALEAELRKPTAEELAEPWKMVEDTDISKDGADPTLDAARAVRAVVTIEGMNRETGIVTIKDSRGKLHLIGDVEPDKMTGVAIGQTAVVVFTEAMAVTLKKQEAEGNAKQ